MSIKSIRIIFTVIILSISFTSSIYAQAKIPSEEEFINIIKTEGITKAVEVFRTVKKNHPEISIFQRETLNTLGWDLELEGRVEEAITVFKLNIEAYPNHYDPYDSYAEVLRLHRDIESAIKNYKISAEINPNNLNATRAITVLENYTKHEYMIPMRDGIKLYTQIYKPKDTSRTYPILLLRDMYRVGNYGRSFRKKLGPNDLFAKEGFIFVYQDIRGRFKSEGEFIVLRPYIPNKQNSQDIDESSDTYDTIEWLLNNIPNNNGRIGQWGGSYSGWLTVMGMINAHPALRASSPGASPADWWMGDDCHHNGAFRLNYAFDWIANDARPRTGGPTTIIPPWFDKGTPDGYKFFLELGPIKNINRKYLHNSNSTWNDYMEHGDYDDYWEAHNILNYLDNITLPVLNIAGWFDAEDYRGPMSIYRTIEENNPINKNIIVVGPWRHGGWHRNGSELGDINFELETGKYFMENIEFPFFLYYLKDKGEFTIPEAVVFETGKNQWRFFEFWPPKESINKYLYLQSNQQLSFESLKEKLAYDFDEFISDPNKPVPYTNNIQNRQGHIWMVEDQRFAARRPDVLVYQSDILTEDITIAGSIIANLFFTSTGTDADWIVKLIDVYPSDSPKRMGDYQMLVAADVFRSKYRNSFEEPEPLVPNEVTNIEFDLLDKFHCFRKGHRIMVQIQSTWFPVIDRNPQKFVDIYQANEEDFQKAIHRVYFSAKYPSHLRILMMK